VAVVSLLVVVSTFVVVATGLEAFIVGLFVIILVVEGSWVVVDVVILVAAVDDVINFSVVEVCSVVNT